MNWANKYLCFALLLSTPGFILAEVSVPAPEDQFPFPDRDECSHAANELELGRCKERQRSNVSARLRELRSEISKELDGGKAEKFQAASKAWDAYAKASCELDSAGAGGNSYSAFYSLCMLDFSLARIRQLEKYRYCVKGGCGQPVLFYTIISPKKY